MPDEGNTGIGHSCYGGSIRYGIIQRAATIPGEEYEKLISSPGFWPEENDISII